MSEKNIYSLLRAGGLSPEGACAMMGNWQAESGCISCRLQGDFSKDYQNSKAYTAQVDDGTIDRTAFVNRGPGGGGYGLAQWTYPKRKDNLYAFSKGSGTSIGDETLQCNFCINELQIEPEYKQLYFYLCQTNNLAEATEKVCLEYERPQYPNIKQRFAYATDFYNRFAIADSEPVFSESQIVQTVEASNSDACVVELRTLKQGDKGHDVFVAQCGLFDLGFDCDILDGDFGALTQKAVLAFQQHNKLSLTGIIGQAEWKLILNSK